MAKLVSGLIHREIDSPEAAAFIGKLADLLESAIDFGSRAFVWCDSSSRQSGYHDASLMLLYRHLLEMVDGVSILIRRGAADPCQPLLRSGMEARMGIEFILEADTEKRAIAYQVAHIHRRIAEHTRHDPGTEEGKKFQQILDKDELSSGIKVRPYKSAFAIEKLAHVLAKPEYTPVDQEWQRRCVAMSKKGRKRDVGT